MSDECIDHLAFIGKICPDCGLNVNEYGNTEAQPFDYCQFPDCGCNGARLCMAKEGPNEDSLDCNVEDMWSGKTQKQKTAALKTTVLVSKKERGE